MKNFINTSHCQRWRVRWKINSSRGLHQSKTCIWGLVHNLFILCFDTETILIFLCRFISGVLAGKTELTMTKWPHLASKLRIASVLFYRYHSPASLFSTHKEHYLGLYNLLHFSIWHLKKRAIITHTQTGQCIMGWRGKLWISLYFTCIFGTWHLSGTKDGPVCSRAAGKGFSVSRFSFKMFFLHALQYALLYTNFLSLPPVSRFLT